jgi:CRISPR-associated protein Cas2
MKTTMLYVIAYDIPNDKRRTKVHKALCGFGDWTQYSLFECFLDARELVQLRARLEVLLNPQEDSVRIYPLCAVCKESVETVGSQPPKEKTVFIL